VAGICRDGSGVGQGTGATLGEAHENALKEAETDAMKRAFMTFGNLFGLALYDREQRGVRHAKKLNGLGVYLAPFILLGADGQALGSYPTPQGFCKALKEAICAAAQAHHLRFMQPRAMGSKVSDEWTVPLCVTHHRAARCRRRGRLV